MFRSSGSDSLAKPIQTISPSCAYEGSPSLRLAFVRSKHIWRRLTPNSGAFLRMERSVFRGQIHFF